FHGGASLQEWIIPCVRIEWPLEARSVEVQIEPLPNVLSQRPRLTLRVLRSSLFIEESIAREVEGLIRAAGPRTILFRSTEVQLTPDQEQVGVALRAVEGAVAARGTPLRIEVRDLRTEEVLAAAESTLMTELTGW
ncbi:MAG TPA: hypothetical protein DEP84_18200, partial [Chloroflexi bacterium]|nr:hypothetical protein [Chloroflexota bacterium]